MFPVKLLPDFDPEFFLISAFSSFLVFPIPWTFTPVVFIGLAARKFPFTEWPLSTFFNIPTPFPPKLLFDFTDLTDFTYFPDFTDFPDDL